jgi:hypothetical protein
MVHGTRELPVIVHDSVMLHERQPDKPYLNLTSNVVAIVFQPTAPTQG